MQQTYTPKHHYTPEELDNAAIADLEADARHATEQAADGPHFPERGITRESLEGYAATCRAGIERYKRGGAHRAVLAGKL